MSCCTTHFCHSDGFLFLVAIVLRLHHMAIGAYSIRKQKRKGAENCVRCVRACVTEKQCKKKERKAPPPPASSSSLSGYDEALRYHLEVIVVIVVVVVVR